MEKKKKDWGEIKYAILSALAIAGVIAVALMAPNLFQIFSEFGDFPKSRNHNIRRSLKELKKKGLIKSEKSGLAMTKKGLKALLKYKVKRLFIKHDRKDGYIRLVAFDIPIHLNTVRMEFTNKLKELGFLYLQKSLWYIDCACDDEISFLVKSLRIEKHVRVIKALTIDRVYLDQE